MPSGGHQTLPTSLKFLILEDREKGEKLFSFAQKFLKKTSTTETVTKQTKRDQKGNVGLKGADRACGNGGSPVWLRDGLRLEEADQAIEGLNPEVAILWCEGLKIQRATRQDERERQNVTPLCLVARVRRKKRKKI